MAGKKAISEENLEKLGAKRLAKLLVELSTGNSTITRRLKMELSGEKNPERMSKDLVKRLETVERTTRKIKKQDELKFSVELEAQRKAIVETLSETNAKEAFRLLWKFVGISQSVYDRCLGNREHVGKVFKEAESNLEPLAKKAELDTAEFALQLVELFANTRFVWPTHLIRKAAPVLGKKGLKCLNSKLAEFLNAHLNDKTDDFVKSTPKISFNKGNLHRWRNLRELETHGSHEEHDYTYLSTNLQSALLIIAEILGDVEDYVKYYDEKRRATPSGINDMAEQLLKAKKGKEALKMISSIDFDDLHDDGEEELMQELKDKEITALELLGKKEEAQQKRMQCFRENLSVKQLRDYISKLPDFDDIEAEEEALNYVENHPDKTKAFYFLAEWPSLDRAAKIVLENVDVLNHEDTKDNERLIPIAEALTTDHPVAAIHVYRSVICSMLDEYRPAVLDKAGRLYKKCLKLVTGNKNLGDCDVEKELTDWLEENGEYYSEIWDRM